MLKKFISLFLCLLVVGNLPLLANPKQTKEEKLKTQITNLGVSKNIIVNLNSGETFDGQIAEIKDAVFTVQVLKEGKTSNREINYTEVNKLSEKTAKPGKIPGKVSVGLIAGIAVFAAVVAIAYIKNDRGK